MSDRTMRRPRRCPRVVRADTLTVTPITEPKIKTEAVRCPGGDALQHGQDPLPRSEVIGPE